MLWEYFLLAGVGLALGSFANVVTLRYKGDSFLFSPRVLGGRSQCPSCGITLAPRDLVPVWSFIVLGGACRSCGKRIGMQYPFVEALSALLYIGALWVMYSLPVGPGLALPLAFLWGSAFWLLLVISVIDIRLHIIPDEAHVFIVALGALWLWFGSGGSGSFPASFLGEYAALFGAFGSVFATRAFGAVIGGTFFTLLFLATKGKAMGMGDVKFAAALGFLFGWPDILAIISCSFVLGGAAGILVLLRRTHTMKSAVPFGPFLALAAALVFFFGEALAKGYFVSLPNLLTG